LRGHQVAFWAGVSAFFGNAVALKIVDLINGDGVVRFLGAFVASLFVAGAVYAKQRLDDAKTRRIKGEGNGS
jgi:hypothetical protein